MRELPAEVMDWLNERMSEFYGSRWTSQYPRAALDTWAKGLHDMGEAQIRRALNMSLTKYLAWPPTLPEFRALCAAGSDVPSLEEAWEEAHAIASRWKRPHECSHPIIWHALSQIVNFTAIDVEKVRDRFARNYEKALQQHAAGKGFAAIPQPLPRPEDVKTNYDPAVVAAAREAAGAKLDALMGRQPRTSA